MVTFADCSVFHRSYEAVQEAVSSHNSMRPKEKVEDYGYSHEYRTELLDAPEWGLPETAWTEANSLN